MKILTLVLQNMQAHTKLRFKEAACKCKVKQDSWRNRVKNARGASPGWADLLNRCGHSQCHVLRKNCCRTLSFRLSLGEEQLCCQRPQCSCFHSDKNSTETKSWYGRVEIAELDSDWHVVESQKSSVIKRFVFQSMHRFLKQILFFRSVISSLSCS